MGSWTVRHLSYAGRALLIKSVIGGLVNFWSSAFVLPKRTFKVIDRVCSAFLWKGDPSNHRGARVAWETVAKPKSEGGLGIKDSVSWNQTCALKLIWMLFFNEGSLWVAWVKHNFLHQHTIWELNQKGAYPWYFRSLLKLRHYIFPHIRWKIGDGKMTRFWLDNWFPNGRLLDVIGSNGPALLVIPLRATVSEVWNNGRCRMRHARSENQVLVLQFLTSLEFDDVADIPLWILGNSTSESFNSHQLWNLIRPSCPRVTWHSQIWHTLAIPKHRICSWLFMLNRNPTRDRLVSWGITSDSSCLLCSSATESRDHILFECSFSSIIWYAVMTRLGHVSFPSSWLCIYQWLLRRPFDTSLYDPAVLALHVVTYELWKERNTRFHSNSSLSPQILLRTVDRMYRNRASSIRLSNPDRSSRLLQLWFSRSFPPLEMAPD